jgi:hypothetical protein
MPQGYLLQKLLLFRLRELGRLMPLESGGTFSDKSRFIIFDLPQ